MKVISSIYDEKKNAGPKAPSDIDRILEKEFNATTLRVIRNRYFKFNILKNIMKLVFCKELIVIQHPLILQKWVYKFIPKKKTILLIHDINGLRFNKKEQLEKEIEIFKKFKYIIVHNTKMKKYLINNGIKEDTLYNLELFDYLANGKINKNYQFNEKNFSVLYPGNLRKEKSPFVYELQDEKLGFNLNLYGVGISNNISKKILYKGSFEPDDLSTLEGDLGLVWDGELDDSDRKHAYKKYTQYNNPHKISCCLAIGIPVIVWENAAVADFVIKNNIGYTIKKIYDINHLDFADYDIKRKNAQTIGKQLREGYYTKRVINDIIKKMN